LVLGVWCLGFGGLGFGVRGLGFRVLGMTLSKTMAQSEATKAGWQRFFCKLIT